MSTDTELPECWSRPSPAVNPVRTFQRTLFGDPEPEPETKPEDVLAELKVSTSDMERWHQIGWISYRLHELSQFCHRDECEIRFIAPIARSGLSDSQINQLLKELRAPYAYGDDVAYHFKYGWVTPQHAFDFVSSNVDEWLDQLGEEEDFDRLAELGNKIYELLHSDVEEAQDEEEDESDDESCLDTDKAEETTVNSTPPRFTWHEVSDLPNGHGIELHDIGISGDGVGLSENSRVGFIVGFDWLHGRSNDVVAYCVAPNSQTPESVLAEMKATVEKFLSNRRIPPENITSRIKSCTNC